MPGRRPTPMGPDVQFERLRDGAGVDFVSMSPDDAERLVRFHHDLSPESVYLRFFTCHPELDPSELYRFTHVDHRDREAIIAVVDGEIVAVARFDRLERPTDAKVAFVVADAWQGRGLGSLLFDRIANAPVPSASSGSSPRRSPTTHECSRSSAAPASR